MKNESFIIDNEIAIDLNKKSVWWSYEIFSQQIDANRWYNINNCYSRGHSNR